MKKLMLLFPMLLMLAGLVSAAVFDRPNTGATIGETYQIVINVTATGLLNITNCSVTGASTLTGESFTWTNITNTSSSNSTRFQFSWANTFLNATDATDWSFSGTCYNGSGSTETITARSSITVDNTVPSCVWGSTVYSSDNAVPQSHTYALTGGNGTEAKYRLGGNKWYTMSESSDNFTHAGYHAQGLYTLEGSVSDGTNTTTCTVSSFEIDNDRAAERAAIVLTAQGKKGTGLDINPIFLLIAAVGLIFYFNNRKK